jgi:Zn-dependent M28 family amino/carboxypeptidase
LEALRALLRSETIAKGQAENTIEFHWYSAEEGGLLGSQAVYSKYKKDMREVKAMLQQDMTGFVQGTLDAGLKESVGVIVDYVDQGLTNFIKEVITTVSSQVHPFSDRTPPADFHSTVTSPTSRPNAATLAPTTLPPADSATPPPS